MSFRGGGSWTAGGCVTFAGIFVEWISWLCKWRFALAVEARYSLSVVAATEDLVVIGSATFVKGLAKSLLFLDSCSSSTEILTPSAVAGFLISGDLQVSNFVDEFYLHRNVWGTEVVDEDLLRLQVFDC